MGEKKRASWVLLLFPLTTTCVAQDGGQNGYTPASRSAHQTVWQRPEWETNQLGPAVARTNEFVELATGLNFIDETTDSLTPQVVDMNGPTLAFGADFASFLSPVYTSFLATVTLNDGRSWTTSRS